MLETRLNWGPLKKLCRPVLALGLACAFGGFVAVGCVDNSGDKTYPRADSGAADGGDDASVSDDATTAADAPASDAPAGDTHTGGDATTDLTLTVDAGGGDVHPDSGAGG